MLFNDSLTSVWLMPKLFVGNRVLDCGVVIFDKDGTLIKGSNNMPNVGKWRTSGDAGLCMEWKGKQEKCAHVYKQGNVYKRTVRRKNGYILFEQTFMGFTSGNKIKQKN